METISFYKAKTHLAKLLNRVAKGGEDYHHQARCTSGPVGARERNGD